jgi:hypothetical protein
LKDTAGFGPSARPSIFAIKTAIRLKKENSNA